MTQSSDTKDFNADNPPSDKVLSGAEMVVQSLADLGVKYVFFCCAFFLNSHYFSSWDYSWNVSSSSVFKMHEFSTCQKTLIPFFKLISACINFMFIECKEVLSEHYNHCTYCK